MTEATKEKAQIKSAYNELNQKLEADTYTTTMRCPYQQTAEEFCGEWIPVHVLLTKGDYAMIIWNRGRQVGQCAFSLK